MKLICLLPVRNGAADLPTYLDSVNRYADGIIALDDGSTDETASILRQNPLVLELIENPRRETYVGWNDLENRRRLLRAAERHQPDWILWMDADEVLEPSDAAVLRHFIETEARPRVAYSLEILRLIDDLSTYDKCGMWRPRLYSFEPGYTFPDETLHFELMPEQFGDASPVHTSLRILHRASMTEKRRTDRYRKYMECDPDLKWQTSYDNILDPARNVKKVQARGAEDPVIILATLP